MNSTVRDCIIVGGGVSGVTLAHYLRAAGRDPLVIEKEVRPGGRLQSHRLPGSDFIVETGAHTCYNGYASLLHIARRLPVVPQPLVPLPYLLDSRGQLAPLVSAIPFPSLCLNLTKILFLSKEGKSVRDYYRRLFGARAYDRLFSRAFRAVICQQADDYPATMLLKKRKQRADDFPRKYSFAGGLQALVEAIVEQSAIPLATGDPATAIHRDANRVYIVETASGRRFHSRAVALALDPAAASLLLRPVAPAAADLLATIPLSRVDSLSIVARREDVPARPLSGVIPLRDDYLSIVSADPLAHPLYRAFTLHSAGGTLPPDKQLAVATALLGVSPSSVVATWNARHLLPSTRIEHARLAEQLLATTRHSGIYITGNYFLGLSIEDCVNRSRAEASRFIDENA
ncbi:MAG: FAD-dependent oxidoreductase [Odoribacteraceae bacterium]|jgi:protoporphyrinogen oxidase|nr:FAD-dependent oxidoreductase [Odoribacteraceae bacterium]